MTTEFVPDEALGRIARQTGVAGSTLPRAILNNAGWPQALIEDYDAKGRDQGRGNNDIVAAANGALTAQRWARDNQQLISGLTTRINTLDSQISSIGSRVVLNTSNIARNSASIADLTNRVESLEMQIPMLQPQMGADTPEGNVTSNLNRTYYRIDGMITEIYFNPMAGVSTGWILMT